MRTLRPSGLRLTNSFSARSCPSTTTVAPAFASWAVNGRPCSILRVMISKYRSVVPSSVIPWARFPLYSTVPLSSEYHAVIAGTVNPRVTASASANRMRGRRRHDRHVESLTLKLTLGRCRRWKVFTPTSVPANLSVMYTFMPFTIDHAPIRNVTPMNTPMREKPLFSFWARICCSARRSASNSGTSGGLLLVGSDQAIAQGHDPRGMGGDIRLMRDHHDGLPLAVQVGEDLHDLLTRGRVEVAGRLVGEQDARLVHQRPRDSHALPLAAGQLVRLVLHPIPQRHALQRPRGPRAPCRGPKPRVDEGQLHVVQGGRAGQQVEGLEDEADLLVADPGQRIVGQVGDLLPVEPVLTAARRVEAADQVHERRFPRARGSHHCHILVTPDLDADAAQRAHDLRPHVVRARELVGEDDDVGQRAVARVELLGDHEGFLPRAVSAGCRDAFTAAPSCRSRIA